MSMGYDLYSVTGEDTRWTQPYWSRILKLAVKYGWEPKGTTKPKDYDEDWSGGYYQNSGQIVEADDASNLADALEKSLPHLPVDKPEFTFKTGQTYDPDMSPEEVFSGEGGKQAVEEFIAFCRKGSFEIS